MSKQTRLYGPCWYLKKSINKRYGTYEFHALGVPGEKQTQKRQCGITILNHHSLLKAEGEVWQRIFQYSVRIWTTSSCPSCCDLGLYWRGTYKVWELFVSYLVLHQHYNIDRPACWASFHLIWVDEISQRTWWIGTLGYESRVLNSSGLYSLAKLV